MDLNSSFVVEEKYQLNYIIEDHIAVEKECVVAEKNYVATEEHVVEKELVAAEEEEEPAVAAVP